jgi:hypothetical protein
MSSFVFTVSSTTVHAAQVTLAWDRNAETNVEGYKVYYGTTSRDYDWVIDVGDVTSITITDLTDGFTYYFAATAYDTATPPLESAFSGEVSKNTCSYSISPTSTNFTVSGGTGSVSVTTQAGCPWTASSGAVWMTITSGSSGTGNGTVNYSISSNTGSSRTSGSTIAGRVFTVTQSGATTYTITATAGTGGSISPSGSVSVAQGGSQTFSIAANTGYQISSVMVDGVSQGAISSYSFSNVTAAHTISATFAVRTYAITASAGTGGTISPTGAVSLNHGANQTFTITPNTGYTVSNVVVDGSSVGAVTTYTFSNVMAAHTINATFSAISYTITASAGAGGTISPSGSVSVSHGSNRTFTVTAITGYTIANVLVDGASVGAISSYTFSNVTANHTISATFTASSYTITASAGTGGSISPSGSVSVNHGANQTFTIAASTGYSISSVTVDGVSQGAISSYTFSNVTAAHTISATFAVRTYAITASAGTGGTISPTGSISVNHGANQAFTISASTGYSIASVTVDGASQGAISSYTFSNVTAAHTINATFSAISYTITASAGAGGTISPSGSVSVSHGANRTFTVTANTGYTIANVLVDGASVGAISSYTFSNVTANHTISASFNVITYTISASAGTGGTITPSGSVSVNHGANQIFTITPNTGYGVTNVLVDGASVGAVSSYTFNNVTANHTISASFAVNTYTINASAGTGGSISPSGAVAVSGGTTQAFTIAPNSGYRIADVLVDGSSVRAVSSFTFTNVNSSHTISASFAANTYIITASAGVGGTITPSGSVPVNHGANQTFTITPNTGYTVSNVVVNGSSVGAVTTYTFSNVTAAHTISATFAVRTYAITASAGTGGTITPSGSVSVNHGANQIFTITPNTGYSVATVTVDGVSQGAISSYAFSNVTANHTISATFTANSVIISASAGSGGSISPSGAVTVIYGSNQTFIITPTSGYAISNVLVDGVSQGAVGSYAFGNVTTNHTITASFFQITYTINASASAGGTISPSGSVTVAQGANQVFTITQGSGYTIADVLIDGSSAGAVGSYTFTNVSSSHTISASFVEGYTLMVTTTGTGIGEVTPNPAATVYPPGTKVTLRAEKDVSSTFDGFSGDCTSSRTSCTITMNKHTAVTAAFKLKSLKVKTTVIGSGTVSLDEPMSIEDGKKTKNEKKVKQIKRSKHETKVDYGDQLAYNITPEAGNYIKKIVVDGKSHGSVEALTITDVKRNHNVKVKFESEAKLNPHEKFWLIKHKIFLRDTDEQDEQHALNDLPDDDDDDDDPSESPTTSRIASVKK